jgi:hypothetical protein
MNKFFLYNKVILIELIKVKKKDKVRTKINNI